MLAHERLDVYQRAIEFLALSAELLEAFPRGHANLADQLRQAALSIPLNMAEGAGKSIAGDQGRFFAIARGSAMECAAILDACLILELVEAGRVEQGKGLLERVVGMLTKMCR
jgi:four helix bundle protein